MALGNVEETGRVLVPRESLVFARDIRAHDHIRFSPRGGRTCRTLISTISPTTRVRHATLIASFCQLGGLDHEHGPLPMA